MLMKAEDLILALTGTREERADLDALEVIVTLRKPDEVEELVRQNAELRAKNKALEDKLLQRETDTNELIGLYQRVNQARKVLKRHGLPTKFLDR